MKKMLIIYCFFISFIQGQEPYTVSMLIPPSMQKTINKQPCTFDCDTLNIHFSKIGSLSTTVSASQAPDKFFKEYDISKIFIGVMQEEYKNHLSKTKNQTKEEWIKRKSLKSLYSRVYYLLDLDQIGSLLKGLNGKEKKGHLEYLGRDLVLTRKLQGGSYYLTPSCTRKKSFYSYDSDEMKVHCNAFLKALYQRFLVVDRELRLLLRNKDITLVKESNGTFIIGRKGDPQVGSFEK